MIKYIQNSDILKSNSQALVNTANCVGVMGKGLALQFKDKFPLMFKEYQKLCKSKKLNPGGIHIYKIPDSDIKILNVATKDHWRDNSKIEWIQKSVENIKKVILLHNIKSISIPPLGCGLGGLNWNEVKPIIESVLSDLTDVEILVYEPETQLTHDQISEICKSKIETFTNKLNKDSEGKFYIDSKLGKIFLSITSEPYMPNKLSFGIECLFEKQDQDTTITIIKLFPHRLYATRKVLNFEYISPVMESPLAEKVFWEAVERINNLKEHNNG